jgi:hypothetical protein
MAHSPERSISIVEEVPPPGLFDLAPYYREALVYLEAFRRLGYPASSVFFVVTGAPLAIQVALKHGDHELFCNVERLREGNKREIAEGWKTARAAWKAAEEHDRQMVWRRSYVLRNATDFAQAMVAAGFRVDPAVLRP